MMGKALSGELSCRRIGRLVFGTVCGHENVFFLKFQQSADDDKMCRGIYLEMDDK